MNHSKPFSFLCALSLGALATFFSMGPAIAQGPLKPPGGPAPDGKSLQEISDQVADVKSRLSDLCDCDRGTLLVIDPVRTVSAWKPETNVWASIRPSAEISSTKSTEGNYLVLDKSRNAYAWSRDTGTWAVVVLDAPVSTILTTGGNFVIRTSTNRIFTWSYRTAKWSERHFSSGITRVMTSP